MVGDDAFTNEKWIIDRKTGIAMSVENNHRNYLDFYSTRFSSTKSAEVSGSGKYRWVGEYFCEPDNVLVVDDGRSSKIAYLPYLRWTKDFFVDKKGAFAVVSAYRGPEYGLNPMIEAAYLKGYPNVKLELRSSTKMKAGSNMAETTVYLKSYYQYPVTLHYIIQDAAYMNFKKNNSVGVLPISFRVGRPGEVTGKYGRVKNGGDALYFAGSYRRDHGIVAGFFTDSPDAILGTDNRYLGVKSTRLLREREPRFILDTENVREKVVDAAEEAFDKVNETDFVNRFIMFTVRELNPGEERSFRYYAIMIDRSDEGVNVTMQDWAGLIDSAIIKEVGRKPAGQLAQY